jgi:hypothetical protein
VTIVLIATASPAMPYAIGIVIVGVAVQYASLVIAARKERAEQEAGYTTMRRTRNPGVAQVDHLTGIVLREAHTPLLDRDEYLAAVDAARSAAAR